jgi:long-chain acyl-CoA synthetase
MVSSDTNDGLSYVGDIGTINERGCLIIIDRKKNIFKLAQGEYIAPEKIENVYSKDTLVAQIFVHGDSLQSSLVAVLVPEEEALKSFLAAKSPKFAKLSHSELCKDPEVAQLVLNQLNKVGKKAGLHGFELAKAVYLEEEQFTMEKDLLTPTLKVKRPQAKKYYEDKIAAMYDQINNQPTKAKV